MKFFVSILIKLMSAAVCIVICTSSRAQYNPNSVYSRFGLGIIDPTCNAPHFGMGCITAPISDPVILNMANPASYSFLESTNLQTTVRGTYTASTYQGETDTYTNGQVSQLSMGFKKPTTKWAIAFGLNPYSSVDYRFSSKDTLSDTLTANYGYTGRGGVNKATIGFSRLFRMGGQPKTTESADTILRRVHQLSLGLNANYLFGNITRENVVSFSQTEHYSTVENHNLWIKGSSFEAGMQYKVNLSTRRDPQRRIVGGSALQVGIAYTLNAHLNAEYTELLYSIRFSGNAAFRDTSYFLNAQKGRLVIPQRIQAGIAYKIYHKSFGSIVFAGEYSLQDWSLYRLEMSENVNLDNGLSNATSWSAGIEYKPSTDVSNNFLNRLHYRAGYRSSQTELVIRDTRIVRYATSAGVSIPVIRSLSKLHLSAEWGRRGTTQNDLVQEDYLGFMVGFSLTPSSFDRWFRQVKYD